MTDTYNAKIVFLQFLGFFYGPEHAVYTFRWNRPYTHIQSVSIKMVQAENLFFIVWRSITTWSLVFGISLKQEKQNFFCNFFHLIWCCRSWDNYMYDGFSTIKKNPFCACTCLWHCVGFEHNRPTRRAVQARAQQAYSLTNTWLAQLRFFLVAQNWA